MAAPEASNEKIKYLDRLIAQGKELYEAAKNKGVPKSPNTIKWTTQTSNFLVELYGSDNVYTVNFYGYMHEKNLFVWARVRNGLQVLYAVREELLTKPLPNRFDTQPLEKIFNRFHTVATQLLHRREDRPTLVINDEYDVQDLLCSLLRLHFDDVRREVWTPDYAGRCSRMDLLLNGEKTGIEVKKTSPRLKAGDIADQVIIDIAHYKKYPECRKLVFLSMIQI